MPTIYDLKPAFQNLLRPVSNWLVKQGITANQVTVLALLLSIGTGLILLFERNNLSIFGLVPVVLFCRMALNAIDGMIAREHNMKTALGAILNELGDVISDVALYLPFALLPDVSVELVVLAVFTGIVTEFAGVVAIQVGASRRYDGPMGKSDRAFLFGLMALLISLGLKPGSWINYLLAAILILSFSCIYNRIHHALGELKP